MICVSWGCNEESLDGGVFCLDHVTTSVTRHGAMNWAPAGEDDTPSEVRLRPDSRVEGSFGSASFGASPRCEKCGRSMSRIAGGDLRVLTTANTQWVCAASSRYGGATGIENECEMRYCAMNEERNAIVTWMDNTISMHNPESLDRMYRLGFLEARRRLRNGIMGMEHRNEGREQCADPGGDQARRHYGAERRERYVVAESIDQAFGPEDASGGAEQGVGGDADRMATQETARVLLEGDYW